MPAAAWLGAVDAKSIMCQIWEKTRRFINVLIKDECFISQQKKKSGTWSSVAELLLILYFQST